MAAAPQPNEPRRLRRSTRRDRRRGPAIPQPQGRSPQQTVQPSPRRPRSRQPRKVIRFPFLKGRSAQAPRTNTVTTIPQPAPQPQWLGQLHRAYRWSSVAVFSLGVVVAGVYGHTVRLEQDLGTTYTRLQGRQRQERELPLAMEQLKDQIARQAAQPESGLALPKPKDQVFVAPANPQEQQRPNAEPVMPQRETSDVPVGY